MNLSAAIREGAKLGPQLFRGGLDHSRPGAMCAIVGASVATGLDVMELGNSECPCGGRVPRDCSHLVRHHVYHLNDNKHWTREQIADWVQALEEADEAGKRALGSVTEKELVPAR